MTETFTSTPLSPSLPLFWLPGLPGIGEPLVGSPPLSPELLDGMPLREAEELLDDELLELGIEGEEGIDEEEALGIDGEDDDDDEGLLGIDGAELGDGEEVLGMDGAELLELELEVDSHPPSSRPSAEAATRVLSVWCVDGVRMLLSSSIARNTQPNGVWLHEVRRETGPAIV